MSDDDPEKVDSNNENANDRRRTFLKDIRPHMENYFIKDMPEYLKRYLDIEVVYGSLWKRTVWKKFVNNMGIIDSGVINKIEHRAITKSDSPLYIAMDEFLKDRSFAVVIDCMLNTECVQQENILENLEDYVRSLLSRNVHPNSITFQNAEGRLKVLILHSKVESTVAEELSAEFTENDSVAITLTQVIRHGSENDLKTLYQQADFIVPVISSTFIEEIQRPFPTSAYMQYNRDLYELMKEDRRRVRPVIVKEMRRSCIDDPILRYSFRLFNEVPKFIGVLKETKGKRARLIN